MINKLFVYGTLGPGQPNEHILTQIGGTWTKASVRGYLVEEGWAVELGYPAIRLDETASPLKGHIFQSSNLKDSWPALDEFEGEEYRRVEVCATLEDGTTTTAYVYEANAPEETN